jgi:predicted glycogen debranching enzyme
VAAAGARDELDAQLVLAADQFAITTGGRPTAVAGYPWFGEWSRDLMTSYEGLYLTTNRPSEGREVLLASAATVSEGMLANTADTGTLEYNTVDGTLWFVHAVGRHVEVAGDDELGNDVSPMLDQIVQHHVEGTRFGIGVDPDDGLLRQGAEGWALTWMDARIDGVPVTPRVGKPVEVNALWLRSLQVTARLTGDADMRDRCNALHAQAASSFSARFARPDGLGLYDVVDGPAGDDASIRPNQLLAVSLPGSVLDEDTARSVLDICSRSLLTPLGLRSLAPDDPRYRPYHRGGPAERDGAYHEGTVWPWLLGPYVDTARRLGAPLDGLLDGIEAHVGDWGLGSVSETADGAAPHAATGCPFQAWSVAELLRARAEPAQARKKRKKAAAHA